MHLNLLTMLPNELREKLDKEYALIIQVKPACRYTLWPRLRTIIYHFTDDDAVRQAATQYLAHHQCIISNILLGISLCPTSTARGTITSQTASEQYLSSGIRTLYKYHQTLDFTWLTEHHKTLWQHCCHTFLLYEYKKEKWNNELIEFAESQCDPLIFSKQA